MLFLISPAKALDYDTPVRAQAHTAPLFVAQSKQLIEELRQQSPQQIAELMGLSDNLAALNVARYQRWSSRATQKNARQAVLAFDGDVYGGLDARSMDDAQLAWLQERVCILSGLYGVLRPLDLMQAYRLEMGTRLANALGKDLYAFWRTSIAKYLNTRLRSDAATNGSAVVVNLASQEYFKAVDTRALKARVLHCVFQERRDDGQYKVISFMAKRARGLMVRFAAENQLSDPQDLRAFALEGYAWQASASSEDIWTFRRDLQK